jgi:GNAT superfamily N-acetyltransferase
MDDPVVVLDVYKRVGEPYGWRQAAWSMDDLVDHLASGDIRTYVFTASGSTAGFLKIVVEPDGNVQIGTFALLPEFTGQGLGGHALTIATQHAWSIHDNVSRVWLRTVTSDHPHAYPNYIARGFTPYKTEET